MSELALAFTVMGLVGMAIGVGLGLLIGRSIWSVKGRDSR